MKTEHRYELIVYWSDEDNAFISIVPELPGCAADGATSPPPTLRWRHV
jgi:predicted RNase H-like HicB family nuclease